MRRRYSRRVIQKLRDRWKGQEERIAAILADVRSGEGDWTRHFLASPERGWDEFPLLETCSSRFQFPGESARRDLRGLQIGGSFFGTTGFADTCLDGAVFDHVDLAEASLQGSSLQQAEFLGECHLDGARLQMANLAWTDYSEVSFVRADLTEARICGADFRDAILTQATLRDVHYSVEPWWGFLAFLRFLRRWPRFGGRDQSPSQLGQGTDPLITRYIADQNLRWFFARQHRIMGFLRYILSNYGQSFRRVLLWAVLVWFFFGWIYAAKPLPRFLDWAPARTVLRAMKPEICWKQESEKTWLRPYYFSAATMTTLGYGDNYPLNAWAQVYCGVQALLGFGILAMLAAALFQDTTNLIWPDGVGELRQRVDELGDEELSAVKQEVNTVRGIVFGLQQQMVPLARELKQLSRRTVPPPRQ